MASIEEVSSVEKPVKGKQIFSVNIAVINHWISFEKVNLKISPMFMQGTCRSPAQFVAWIMGENKINHWDKVRVLLKLSD